MTAPDSPPSTTPTASSASARPRKRTHPLLLLLLAVVPVAAVAYAVYVVQIRNPRQENLARNQDVLMRLTGLAQPVANRLDARFTDANQDELADPPADTSKLIDPPTLRFSYVAVDDPGDYQKAFAEFLQHLSRATGRPVEYLPVTDTTEQVKAMRDGTLHVAGFNTGSVPLAVNVAGFVPVVALGNESGAATYKMKIIVPADSQVRSVPELKGKEITFTEPGSNSGYKAPLVLLKDQGLLPTRDFDMRYSGGHEQSVLGVASRQYQAAAVASDYLERMLAAGKVQAEQFRTIYESSSFPTASLGYVHHLKPELARQVADAFTSFDWKGTGLEKEFGQSRQTKFVPVNYKEDWALVRRIDNEIGAEHKVE